MSSQKRLARDMPRVYLHYADAFTFAFTPAEGAASAGDALSAFRAQFLKTLGAHAPPHLRLLLSGAALPPACSLASSVPDGADVDVVPFSPPLSSPSPPPAAASATPAKPPPPALSPAAVKALLAKADALAASGQLAASNDALAPVVSSPSSAPPAAFLRLASNLADAGRGGEAAAAVAAGLRVHPRSLALLVAAGEAAHARGEFPAAVDKFEAAVAELRKRGGGGGGGAKGGGGGGSAAAKSGADDADDAFTEVELLSLAAGSLFRQGGRAADAAAALVMRLLSMDGSSGSAPHQPQPQHPPPPQPPAALRAYAVIARAQGHVADAVGVALRLLAASPKDASLAELLAACVGGDDKASTDGVAPLLELLGATAAPARAAASAFAAASLKDAGAVPAACAVFASAAAASPAHAGHALAHAHCLEAAGKEGEALAALTRFFEAAVAASPPLGPLGPLDIATHVLPLLRGAPAVPRNPGVAMYAADGGLNASLLSPPQPSSPPPPPSPPVKYISDQLDALACVFTAAKLLFASGAVARAAALASPASAARDAAATPLHATRVRNEAAYLACVAGAASKRGAGFPPFSPMSPPPPPLFLLGDSHVLPPAWRCVSLRGSPRCVVPVLVTGLKAWHLRPGCDFYPAFQFRAAVRRLPSKCCVIALFGEIDCREGLLRSVEKGAQPSLPAAAAACARLAVAALVESVVKGRSGEVFVHPVPPVLSPTRPLVDLYNAALAAEVKTASAALAGTPAAGRLHWLDFAGKLVREAGAAAGGAAEGGAPPPPLREEYEMDGTHLSPKYVELLQAALDEVA